MYFINLPLQVNGCIHDHCGSGLYDTYLHVLNVSGQEIYSNDDDWEYELLRNPYNSYLYIPNLSAGTYYVVSEGYSGNGNITTSIRGIRPLPPTGLYYGSAVTALPTTDKFISIHYSYRCHKRCERIGSKRKFTNRTILRWFRTTNTDCSARNHSDKQDLPLSPSTMGAGREQLQWLPILLMGMLHYSKI
jgi:hypothetical protein